MKVYLINREQDIDRRQHFLNKWPAGFPEVDVIKAVDGHHEDFSLERYSDVFPGHWLGRKQIKVGALACSLSHMKAWTALIESGEDMAMVFEDDAVCSPKLLSFAQQWATAPSCDVLMTNKRVSDWLTTENNGVAPLVSVALANLGNTQLEKIKAPGSDGYMLTREGAEKLIKKARRDGFCYGMDWFLVTAGLHPHDFPTGIEDQRPLHFLKQFCRGEMTVRFLSPPLSWEIGTKLGGSTVGHKNTVTVGQ